MRKFKDHDDAVKLARILEREDAAEDGQPWTYQAIRRVEAVLPMKAAPFTPYSVIAMRDEHGHLVGYL